MRKRDPLISASDGQSVEPRSPITSVASTIRPGLVPPQLEARPTPWCPSSNEAPGARQFSRRGVGTATFQPLGPSRFPIPVVRPSRPRAGNARTSHRIVGGPGSRRGGADRSRPAAGDTGSDGTDPGAETRATGVGGPAGWFVSHRRPYVTSPFRDDSNGGEPLGTRKKTIPAHAPIGLPSAEGRGRTAAVGRYGEEASPSRRTAGRPPPGDGQRRSGAGTAGRRRQSGVRPHD